MSNMIYAILVGIFSATVFGLFLWLYLIILNDKKEIQKLQNEVEKQEKRELQLISCLKSNETCIEELTKENNKLKRENEK